MLRSMQPFWCWLLHGDRHLMVTETTHASTKPGTIQTTHVQYECTKCTNRWGSSGCRDCAPGEVL